MRFLISNLEQSEDDPKVRIREIDRRLAEFDELLAKRVFTPENPVFNSCPRLKSCFALCAKPLVSGGDRNFTAGVIPVIYIRVI